MKLRFYVDAESGEPHIRGHRVYEPEVEQVLAFPLEDRPGRNGSRVAIGRTVAGRYLRVVYVTEYETASVFVITAFELQGKPLTAFKRRMRRRNQ